MTTIRPPVLSIHADYILPTSERDFGRCGLSNYEQGCFQNMRFIDVLGQEWLVENAKNDGYVNWLQRLYWRTQYKMIKVSFSLRQGRRYTCEQLKSEIQTFLVTRSLRDSPFEDKHRDVPMYLAKFESTEDLVRHLGYFDARARV